MKRIKTFALFEADTPANRYHNRPEDCKQLIEEISPMFMDYGYTFSEMRHRGENSPLEGVVGFMTVLTKGNEKLDGQIGTESTGNKTCLLRELIDQFVMDGKLEDNFLMIGYTDPIFKTTPLGQKRIFLRFDRDMQGDKITFSKGYHDSIDVNIPLSASITEIKSELKEFIDKNIVDMDSISMKSMDGTFKHTNFNNVELARKIAKAVTKLSTQSNALNIILDDITNEKLGEVSIRMSDSLYERMQITQYLKSRGFSEHKIKEIQQARTDKKSGNELSVHKIEDDKKKLELLALDLCHEFINYGINFMPLHTLKESFTFQPKTPSIITQSVNAIYGSHMINVHGLTFFPGTEDKWILTRNPPLLRKLICELIFGLEETDSKSYELEFNQQYNHRYMSYQIMLSDEYDGKVELGKIENHGYIIKIPENMPPDESVSQIREVINENIKSVRGIDLKYETDDENDVNDDGDPMLYYTESALEKPWKIEVFGVIVDVVSAAPKQEIIDPSKYINEVIDRIKRNDIVYELINGMRHDTVNKIEPLIIKRKGIDMDEINLMARMRKRRKYT